MVFESFFNCDDILKRKHKKTPISFDSPDPPLPCHVPAMPMAITKSEKWAVENCPSLLNFY